MASPIIGFIMFTGSIVAIVTPMYENGEIAYDSFRDLIEWHIQEKTDAIVVLGTTGEVPTLTHEEKINLVRQAREQTQGRIPLIVGTGTNSTRGTIEATRQAMELGADACLLVAPYYNKPTQEGLYQHYLAIANAVNVPQILYNVPGRTACDILPETVVRLANHKNIVGVKEASGKIERVTQIRATTSADFALLSGDDSSSCAHILQGGDGVISVVANVAPRLMHDMCAFAKQGDVIAARALDQKLYQLHTHLFIESNPIPVKWALAKMGLISGGIRLPLTPLAQQYHQKVEAALLAAGIKG